LQRRAGRPTKDGIMATKTIGTVELPSGEAIPVLGQGTWAFAEGGRPREQKIAALRHALDLERGLALARGAAAALAQEALELTREHVARRKLRRVGAALLFVGRALELLDERLHVGVHLDGA
jgi:hypothetical protein